MPKKVMKKAKTRAISFDAKVWKMPLDPPETSQAQFPFTLQGNAASFGVDSSSDYTLTYSSVAEALQEAYGITSNSISVRVTHYGVYGPTSPLATGGTTPVPNIPFTLRVDDAFTGRNVQNTSTPVKRARGGFIQPEVRAMKWYSHGNRDSVAEKHIAYLRYTDSGSCPPANWLDSFTIVIRGFARISRVVGTCS